MPLFPKRNSNKGRTPDLSTLEGFEQTYFLYYKQLLTVAHNQLRNKIEAENIVQDVFCRLWERKDELMINGSIENYLMRAVKLAVFSFIKVKLGRRQLDHHIYKNIPQQRDSLEEEVRFNELVNKTNELTAQLPPRRREIYRLSTEKLMTNQEIASALAISKKTVDSQLTKALKFLRKNLRIYFEEH